MRFEMSHTAEGGPCRPITVTDVRPNTSNLIAKEFAFRLARREYGPRSTVTALSCRESSRDMSVWTCMIGRYVAPFEIQGHDITITMYTED